MRGSPLSVPRSARLPCGAATFAPSGSRDIIIDDVRAQAVSKGLRLLVQAEPGEEPSPAAAWNWYLTCVAGDVEVDVMASQDLESFAVEDESGRFEIDADAVTFPEVLTRRLLQ